MAARGRPPIRPLSPEERVAVSFMRAYDAFVTGQGAAGAIRDADPRLLAAETALAQAREVPGVAPRHAREVEAPLFSASESNVRAHWSAKYRRSKEHRSVLPMVLRTSISVRPPASVVRVTLVRSAPAGLDDDNDKAAMKSARDAVAMDYLGLDDADPRLAFGVEQRRAERYAIGVRLEWGFGACGCDRCRAPVARSAKVGS